ncbi:MAG: TonB-dependent receptor [Chitinophagales bacterium]|nr:TonB-dependent receptor [Chitinophagales bacterium]
MQKHLIIGLGLVGSSLSSFAQQALDTVIIHENRIQASFGKQNRNMQVMDRKQIATLPVKSTAELLAYVAGADFRQRGPNGTQADISIDGSTFDQVLVLVNGVKMSDPQTGHHMMNLPIPISAIEQIEVLRGPAAMVYGVNALAGAINIVTRIPQQNEISAQVYAGSNLQTDTASGDTYYGWGAQASASFAGKQQSHILSVAHDEGNGYRYNTAYKATRLFYQNRIVLNGKNSIDAMGAYIHNDFGANGYYAAPVDANSTETVQTAMGSIAYTLKPTGKLMIRPRVSYRYNNDDYIFVRQNPSLYHNIHETNVVTGEVQSSYTMRKGTVGIGVEYRNEDINSTNLGKRNRNNTGIYAEYKHYFNDKLNTGLGVYANYNSDYGWQAFPGLDAGYRFLPKWKVFANASMGQRLPTYTDLYYNGPTNTGNPNLQPELAHYAEGGLQYNGNLLFARAAYFYKNNTDFIDWVRTNTLAPWQPQNFQSVNTNGISGQVTYKLSKHLALSDKYVINLQGNYTYLSPVIETPNNAISKYAVEALRHQAIASVRSMLWNKLQINANVRYLYRINANDYTLVDARVAYRIKQFNIYADVNNILDTKYREASVIQLPGRWYTVGVQFNTTY